MRYTIEVLGETESESPVIQEWIYDDKSMTLTKTKEWNASAATSLIQRLAHTMAMDIYRVPGVTGGVYWMDDRMFFFITLDSNVVDHDYLYEFLVSHENATLLEHWEGLCETEKSILELSVNVVSATSRD